MTDKVRRLVQATQIIYEIYTNRKENCTFDKIVYGTNQVADYFNKKTSFNFDEYEIVQAINEIARRTETKVC